MARLREARDFQGLQDVVNTALRSTFYEILSYDKPLSIRVNDKENPRNAGIVRVKPSKVIV